VFVLFALSKKTRPRSIDSTKPDGKTTIFALIVVLGSDSSDEQQDDDVIEFFLVCIFVFFFQKRQNQNYSQREGDSVLVV